MLTSPNHLVQGFQAWLGLSLNTYENYEWVLTNPNHLVARVRKPKISRAWVKIKTRRKLLLVPRRKPKMLLLLNSAKLLTRWPPKWKLRIWGHFFYFYLFSFAVVFVVFFLKGIYHTFFMINERIFPLFSISSSYILWVLVL